MMSALGSADQVVLAAARQENNNNNDNKNEPRIA
jgi:hypothetical protein